MNIAWNSLMTTGVPELDDQHRALIDALNQLAGAMAAGKGTQEIENILTFAGEYAQSHFKTEEAYFEKYHCPASVKNRQEHAQFLTRFRELYSQFHERGADFKFISGVYRELSDWLVHHILGVDIQLRDVIKK
jgi:hemerythrin